MVVLTALEKQYCHLAQIKIDEMTRLMGHIRSEITSDNAMPRRIVLLVELFLDIRSYILHKKKTTVSKKKPTHPRKKSPQPFQCYTSQLLALHNQQHPVACLRSCLRF